MPIAYSTCSPNYLTLGFSHDWAWVDGWLRVSGEDGYSALRAPRSENRCKALTKWALNKYPFLDGKDLEVKTLYGVYTETSDKIPVLGRPYENSALCYLVGCNAWAQGPLSYCAHLIPGILEWVDSSTQFWTPERLRISEFVSMQRFRIPEAKNLSSVKVSAVWEELHKRTDGEARGGLTIDESLSNRRRRIEKEYIAKL